MMTKTELQSELVKNLLTKLTMEGAEAARRRIAQKSAGLSKSSCGASFDDGWVLDAAYHAHREGNYQVQEALLTVAMAQAEIRLDYVRAHQIAELANRQDLAQVYESLERLLR